MDVDVRHLELVAAIADEGGLTRASHRLHLTQPALSHRLRDIEESLGTRLFERLNHKMVLTPAGERLLQTARRVLEDIRGAEDDIRRAANGQHAILRLSTLCYTCYDWLPSRLRLYQRDSPRVQLRVVVDPAPTPLEALRDGRLDLLLSGKPVRDRHFVSHPLFAVEMVAVVPRGHRFAGRPFIEPTELSSEDLILYPPKEDSWLLRDVLGPLGIFPRSIVEARATEAILGLVQARQGIALLAHWAVRQHVKSGDVCVVRFTRGGFFRPWQALTLRGRELEPHITRFIELLRDHPLPARSRRARVQP